MRKPNNQGVRKTSSGYLTSSRCSLTSHLSKSLLVFLTRRAHITSSTHSVSLMTFVPPKQREWRFGRKPQHHQIGARGRAHALISPMLHPRPSYPTSLRIIPSCISSPVKFDPLLLVSAVRVHSSCAGMITIVALPLSDRRSQPTSLGLCLGLPSTNIQIS